MKPIQIGNFKYNKKINDKNTWCHINVYFSNEIQDKHLPSIKRFARIIYSRIFFLIERGFYLIPTGKFLMFSCEIIYPERKEQLERILNDIKKIYIDSNEDCIFEKIELEWDTNDYENGEGYLNVMNSIMQFNLIYEDHSPSHLVHTIINSFMTTKIKEAKFYKLISEVVKP